MQKEYIYDSSCDQTLAQSNQDKYRKRTDIPHKQIIKFDLLVRYQAQIIIRNVFSVEPPFQAFINELHNSTQLMRAQIMITHLLPSCNSRSKQNKLNTSHLKLRNLFLSAYKPVLDHFSLLLLCC